MTVPKKNGGPRLTMRKYPWQALEEPGGFFLIPGRIDRGQLTGLYVNARWRGLAIQVQTFRHSVRVERKPA
jgi:hypothetical protein